MRYFDVFNGDADGICALHQLRLAEPRETVRITGVKRDIALLQQVQAAAGDQVTVLDISLDKNRDALLRLLQQGVQVHYFDHHFAGDIPDSDSLQVHIDTDSNMCSSLLVNDYLQGQFLSWAVVAAYGDNLFQAAEQAAQPLQLAVAQREQLKLLGTLINYNGYGASVDDLLFAPDDLYLKLSPYADPFDFIGHEPAYQQLLEGYQQDMAKAAALEADDESDSHALYILPNKKWARRVSGTFANQLAQSAPQRAHALLTINATGDYVVSVRAPLNNKNGADALCRQFATGGGRKAAAGINHLPAEQLTDFRHAFMNAFIASE